jgi:arylsulfate sulfotransferase
MPNGNIMLFDNGDNRNYVGYGPYSRAVEYEIDEYNRTVRQVWQYGKERGDETYSPIFSDVEYDPGDNLILFSPGTVSNTAQYGKVIGLDYSTGNVIFEATISTPLIFVGTLHRAERMPVYPE